MTTKVPKFCLLSIRENLPSYPWAVLGEGCSSARDSFEGHGRFYFPQAEKGSQPGKMIRALLGRRCDLLPAFASV
jgi:hypothetical protein